MPLFVLLLKRVQTNQCSLISPFHNSVENLKQQRCNVVTSDISVEHVTHPQVTSDEIERQRKERAWYAEKRARDGTSHPNGLDKPVFRQDQ